MKLVIEIEMENAAFDPDPNPELRRILAEFYMALTKASPLNQSGLGNIYTLRDFSGNKVGEVRLEE